MGTNGRHSAQYHINDMKKGTEIGATFDDRETAKAVCEKLNDMSDFDDYVGDRFGLIRLP